MLDRSVVNQSVLDSLRELKETSLFSTQQQLKNKILNDLSFLVYSNAKRYRTFENYEDLLQEGRLGLLKAINKFEVGKFENFIAYAEQWVKNHIRQAAKKFDIVYAPNRNRTVYFEDADKSIEESLLAESPEEIFYDKEKSKILLGSLEQLDERAQLIIKGLFGLKMDEPQSLRKVAKKAGVTYERVRQIKNETLAKLSKNPDIKELTLE